MNQYCVILGDLVESQEIADRERFEEKLESLLSTLNTDYKNEIHAPFTTLKGVDEIGGVLNSVAPLADIQTTIFRQLHPENMRIAAVVGEVDVNVNSKDISEMDGMAFARADTVLSEIEVEGLTFRFTGKGDKVDTLISDEINLLNIVRSDWSERKMEVIREYDSLNSQKEVAKKLDISPQAVSKHLRGSNVEQVRKIEERLSEYLYTYSNLEVNE